MSDEPLHVTFARRVLGKKELVICSDGTVDVHHFHEDRAYCQELAELNWWSVETLMLPDGPTWKVSDIYGEVSPMYGIEWCACVLCFAIAAHRAGVVVKVPK